MNSLVRRTVIAISTLVAGTAEAGITFYENENFTGRTLHTDRAAENFVNRGFNDRARSAIVEGSGWEVCVDINYMGGCTLLKPGRYPSLRSLASQISSTRPVSRHADERHGDRTSGRASATLFAGPNLTGRAVSLGGGGDSDLYGKFDNQASSLRVTRGYWLFCTQAEFRGECRTFGPGDYSVLPRGFDNRITSGRAISDAYPYAGNTRPNWR